MVDEKKKQSPIIDADKEYVHFILENIKNSNEDMKKYKKSGDIIDSDNYQRNRTRSKKSKPKTRKGCGCK